MVLYSLGELASSLWFEIAVAFILMLLVSIYLLLPSRTSELWFPNENTYIDPNHNNEQFPFPSLSSPPTVDLSLIVPAYNEEERLPIMLDQTLLYLKKRQQNQPGFKYEIIIVDDGSKDNTSRVALEYVRKETVNNIRLLALRKNRGKGGAVKRGMLCARGRQLLMVDADGATEISDLDRLEQSLSTAGTMAIAVGSRAHMESSVVRKRSMLRNVLMYGFHVLVRVLGVHGIRDTQCGFKLFTRPAAQRLAPGLHIERWAFDVEMLYSAQATGVTMVEVAVNWREIAGSKLDPFWSSIQMARDLARIRLAFLLGLWILPES